jgi:hypothetical protein
MVNTLFLSHTVFNILIINKNDSYAMLSHSLRTTGLVTFYVGTENLELTPEHMHQNCYIMCTFTSLFILSNSNWAVVAILRICLCNISLHLHWMLNPPPISPFLLQSAYPGIPPDSMWLANVTSYDHTSNCHLRRPSTPHSTEPEWIPIRISKSTCNIHRLVECQYRFGNVSELSCCEHAYGEPLHYGHFDYRVLTLKDTTER